MSVLEDVVALAIIGEPAAIQTVLRQLDTDELRTFHQRIDQIRSEAAAVLLERGVRP